jgi:hypothetical protein
MRLTWVLVKAVAEARTESGNRLGVARLILEPNGQNALRDVRHPWGSFLVCVGLNQLQIDRLPIPTVKAEDFIELLDNVPSLNV